MQSRTASHASDPRNKNRQGMTLLEVIIAIGIFSASALMCLLVLATSVERNRSTRLTVASTSAARQTIEETMAMAGLGDVKIGTAELTTEGGEADINRPDQLCAYLLSNDLDDGFEVTDETGAPIGAEARQLRQITCRFPAMVPGDSSRTAKGLKRFADPVAALPPGAIVAEATMTVYLDESAVPTALGGATKTPLWHDLAAGSTAEGPEGFDMNGDGIIQNRGVQANKGKTEFSMIGVPDGKSRLVQVPVDVTLVYYYQDPGANADRTKDTRGRQTHTYRLIVNNL